MGFVYCRAPDRLQTPKGRLLWAILQVLDRFDRRVPLYDALPEETDEAPGDPVYIMAVDRQRAVWAGRLEADLKRQFRSERKRFEEFLEEQIEQGKTLKEFQDGAENFVDTFEGDWEAFYTSAFNDVGLAFAERTAEGFERGTRVRVGKQQFLPGVSQAVAAWIRVNGAERIQGVLGKTKERVRRAIALGVERGETLPEIAKRVDRLYLDQIIPNRSMVIARTETLVAGNLGAQTAAKETGLTIQKRWLTLRDGRVRTKHKRVHGQRRPIDEPYDVAGDQLMFPGDGGLGAAPDNIIQCRCTETYQAKKPKPPPRRG